MSDEKSIPDKYTPAGHRHVLLKFEGVTYDDIMARDDQKPDGIREDGDIITYIWKSERRDNDTD